MTNIKRFKSTWSLAPYALLPDKSTKLHWDQLILESHGTLLLRKKLTKCLEGFLWIRLGDENVRGRIYSPNTIVQEYELLRLLARWMSEHEIWSLADFESDDFLDFLKARTPRGEDKFPARTTVENWIEIFSSMWLLRSKYPGAVRFDALGLADEIKSSIRTRENRSWRALDDDLAYALINDAIFWVDNFGDAFVEILNNQWKMQLSLKELSGYKKNIITKQFYSNLSEDPKFKLIKAATKLDLHPSKLFSKAFSIIIGACLVLLLFLVGLRVSELLALDNDCLFKNDPDGNGELTYLRGIAAKKHGARRAWVAAEPIDRVINFLTKLRMNASDRELGSTKALFLANNGGSVPFMPGKPLRRMHREVAVMKLEDFVTRDIRVGVGKIDRFHPHMARKTFAQLAVKRNKNNLESVCAHLGHVYRSFTDGKYVGIDHPLSKLLDEADRTELANSLERLLTSKKLLGGGAAKLAEAGLVGQPFRGKRALSTTVNSLIARGVRLAPCDWGYCVYSVPLSACQGNEAGPNEAKRSPEVCSGCRNFVITERHLPWWEDRAKREGEFLMQAGLPAQTKALVARRLEKTEKVLAEIVWKGASRQSPINEKK